MASSKRRTLTEQERAERRRQEQEMTERAVDPAALKRRGGNAG